MARPRLVLPETDIAAAYTDGQTILALAQLHGVDRDVIRRILTEHDVPRREDRGRHWAAKRAARASQEVTA